MEALRGPERARAFAALIQNTARAEGHEGLSATQRFTPPWIADWMAQGALALVEARAPRCVDPACGGGRLLLSLLEGLLARGLAPGEALGCLVGADLDPLAAQVTRMALWLRAAAAPGADPGALALPAVVALEGEPLRSGLGALAPWGALSARAGLAPGAFDVVLSNPPYMSVRHLSEPVREALRAHFGAFAGDLYTAFLARCGELLAPEGALAVLCQQSFLFIERDRALRRDFFQARAPHRLLHLGANAFPGFQGEKAAVVALIASARPGGSLEVFDLHDLPDAASKAREAARLALGEDPEGRIYRGDAALARARRGEPLVYWLGPGMTRLLDAEQTLGERLDLPGTANKTADNARFVRMWWEAPPREHGEGRRWVHYAKGGPRCHWYGNRWHVVDWSPEARAAYAGRATANLLTERHWFREAITWSDLGGRAFSARWHSPGGAFDMAGPAALVPEGEPLGIWFWLGLLNSGLACHLLNARNATIHYQVGDLRRLPLPSRAALEGRPDLTGALAALAQEAVALQRRRAAWTLRDPDEQRALLWEAPGDALGDRLQAARALDEAAWARLEAIQGEVDARAVALYDAPQGELAALTRRARPPAPRGALAADRALCLDAVEWTVRIAQGAAQAPKKTKLLRVGAPLAQVEAAGAALWGSEALWAALQAAALGATGAKALASLGRARARWFARCPWHPARARWALP